MNWLTYFRGAIDIFLETALVVLAVFLLLFCCGFLFYYIGRLFGAGLAKSWFNANKQNEENGGLNNGNE